MQLTVRDASRFLNVPEKTVYRWIKQAALPSYRIGDQYLFNDAELLDWAAKRDLVVSPACFADDDEEAPDGVAAALEAGGVFHRVGAGKTGSVFDAAVDLVPLPEEIDREFLHQVLAVRGMQGVRVVGDGVAAPEVRHPIVLHVPNPVLTLCFLDRPLDVPVSDGRKADAVFLLVSPTMRAHLVLVARLLSVLRDPAFKAALARRASQAEIVAAARGAEARFAAEPARGREDADDEAS